jgi:hypothetical protein
MDSNNGFVEVKAQEVQLYYNTQSKNYSLEFFIQDYASVVTDEKATATTTYEAIQQQETIAPTVPYTASAGGRLYVDITIETGGQDLSDDETAYTVTVELPELQGKQANNDPVVRTRPTIKFSGGKDRR